MNRFFYVVCLLGLMSIVISCHENTVNEDVRALMSSKLWIPEKISGCKNDYVILRYIKPKSCTSCELDMGRWRVYRRQLENRFKDKVDVFFIIETSNTAEAKRIAATYNFSHNIIIDSIGAFMNENKTIKPFGDERLSDWRSLYLARYGAVLDSLYPGGDDVLKTAEIIFNTFQKEGFKYNA